MNKRCLFLVSSTLCPSKEKVAGDHIRSIFDSKQRYEQTLNTIETIREKCPHSYIVFLETSNMPEEYKKKIASLTEIIIDFSQSKTAKTFTDSANKSLGELYTLLIGMKNVLSMDIEFDTIFKLGGRYYLNSKFDLEKFDSKSVVFREFTNETDNRHKWFGTMMYGIGWERRWEYFEALINSTLMILTGGICDVEHSLHFYLNTSCNKYIKKVDVIGASGLAAVDGKLHEH